MVRRFLWLALGLFVGLPVSVGAAPRPHILFFFADDVGWNDVGYQRSEIRTPHIDQLAEQGVRLEQFYAQPGCTPTRAALLTGRYPIRYGLQEGVLWPWSKGGLPLEERTLGDALREAGYRTALVGKWHLGMSSAEYLPRERGFDHHYGLYSGLIDYWTHRYMGGLDWHRNGEPVAEEGYSTRLIANEAVRILETHDPKQPLFLLVSFNAPHAPLQAPPDVVARYSEIENERRRIYAAMVEVMDEGVGTILKAVDARGLRDDTLVIFASDNGAMPEAGGSNLPLRGTKGSVYEGGVRVPAVVAWKGRLQAGRSIDSPIHIVDLYPTLLGIAGGSREQELPLDGVDAWPLLEGKKPSVRYDFLVNVNRRQGALRRGSWKLVRDYVAGTTELFDLSRDLREEVNQADREAQLVRQMESRLDGFRDQAVRSRFPSHRKPLGFRAPKVWGDH